MGAARQSIADHAIDLLLTDVVLPGGGTGRDLAEAMEISKIPVLYMSGDYRALRELIDAGLPHLEKPFRVTELVLRVREALVTGRRPTADA